MRDWVATVETTHYCLGSVMGPHPYPWMVREFHRVIGDEAREQCRDAARATIPTWWSPASAAARTRSGIFSGFVDDRRRLVGVEPAGGAAVGRGVPGVVHGMRSYLMQDEYGQVARGAVDLRRPRLPGRRSRARATWRRSGGPSTER